MQEAISAAKLQRRLGQTCRVLIDEVSAGGIASARSAHEAPEVDGVIRFPSAIGQRAGGWAQVRITAAGAHDLEAENI
ncbi:MAG: hypothetical protein O2845_03350 [Proteobacteria bacterium]|nr:hypothetical protein [Pseudomonadota bacterium]